jgi:hypothetical protein
MLRSLVQLYGSKLGASDGAIGHVKDFFSGNEVQVPTSKVQRISWDESTVFVNLTKEAVDQSPPHHLTPFGAVA